MQEPFVDQRQVRTLRACALVLIVIGLVAVAAVGGSSRADVLAGGGTPPTIHDARMWERRSNGSIVESVLPTTSSTTPPPTTVAPTTTAPAVPIAPSTTTTSTTATAAPTTVAPTPPAPSTGLALGITHTNRSYETWYDRGSVAQADALLAAHPGAIQNVHLMGWGMGNPEPSDDQYNWTSFDRRLAVVARTGGTPVVTLCCAPDWMKGGEPGTTDWSRLEVAPQREHFADYAELARQVAIRHPEVRHYLVWNEMKGFHDPATNRWRYEDYTELYNLVYDALKSVDPTIQVGGPYVVMNSWRPGTSGSYPSAVRGPWGIVDQRALDVIDYWLAHAHGADFIAVDGSAAVRTGEYLVPPADSVEKFRAISEWISARTSLPLWWAELYPVGYRDTSFTPDQQADLWVRSLAAIEAGGGDVVLYWQPEARPNEPWGGLWTHTEVPGGGNPTAVCTAICDRLTSPP